VAGSSDQARRLGATLTVPSEPPYADPHVRVVWEPGLTYWVSLRRPDCVPGKPGCLRVRSRERTNSKQAVNSEDSIAEKLARIK